VNHWPFIAGAYALTILPTLAMLAASYVAMRNAETEADALKGDR
jgi:hypothetical protein